MYADGNACVSYLPAKALTQAVSNGMRVSNESIAEILQEIGEYLDMQNVPFKPRAYEKAAGAIMDLEESVAELFEKEGMKALETIPGVGKSIAEKIAEFIETGRIQYYAELQKSTPVDLAGMRAVEGLGPKSVRKLYEKLKIKNLADLEKAARAGKIRTLPGFGKKSEENILKGIAFVKTAGGRFILGYMMPTLKRIEARLKALPEVKKIIIAGSVRRRKETIGDADFLIVSEKPKRVMDYFVNMPEVVRVFAHGPTKSSVKISSGIDLDMRIVPEESYGAALNYFTGSKDHNVALRQLAIKKGYKLNEYGLFKGRKQIAGRTEEDLYKALGMAYIEPELRENTGEIEASMRETKGEKPGLPKLVGYKDVEGDLQVQTDWSDGKDSIETMAMAALERGLKYILITDHTSRLAMTKGLDSGRVVEQMKEIDKTNLKLKTKNLKLIILKGTECDILKDGTLDLPDSTLAKLDIVGVSVHSYFNLPREEQTRRIIKAMENPHVDILFHPTGRLINKRPPYAVDMDAIIEAAKTTGTVLEIDSYPDRMDLKDEYIKKCVEKGVKMCIDSDAHASGHVDFLEYGIAQARRGWAGKKDIINAWPLEKMLGFLKKS